MITRTVAAIIAVIALTSILITAAAVSQDANAKCKKRYHSSTSKQSQSIAQANVCGNGNLPLNIKCQNLASQIQGDGNAVNVIGTQ